MKVGSRLDDNLLDRAVEGYNLADGARFGDVLGNKPVMLVFLRHHG